MLQINIQTELYHMVFTFRNTMLNYNFAVLDTLSLEALLLYCAVPYTVQFPLCKTKEGSSVLYCSAYCPPIGP